MKRVIFQIVPSIIYGVGPRLAAILGQLGLHPTARLGRRLLERLKKGGNLPVNVDGLLMSGSLGVHHWYLNELREGRQEAFTADLFERAIKPGMVVLDIGAFLGYYTLLAGRRVGSSGKVYAFEPDPRNFSCLVRNIQWNGFSDRVIAVPKAVSNKNGTVPLVFISRDPSQSSLYHYQGEDVSTIVEGITLDRFLDKAVIVDVIKMDIEGAELRALEGMEQTIARTNERVIMFVECNVSALYSAGDSATALVEWLTELGFTVMVIDEQNRRLSPVGSDIESVKCVNLYCCHEEMP